MPTRRGSVIEHYLARGLEKAAVPQVLTEEDIRSKIAASRERHLFKGNAVRLTGVVRCDLNGYSGWCRDHQDIPDRIALLDDFFTRSVITADQYGGVYFRDEGDCLVVLFSDYFGGNDGLSRVNNFCRAISGRTYGTDGLTAKTVVSAGDVAFFQKSHQEYPDEWSADGDAFIFAARIEAEADSKQVVHFRKEEYDEHFKGTATNDPDWITEEQPARITGLWKHGGHQRLTKDVYRPSGEADDGSEDEDVSKAMTSLLSTTDTPDPYEKRGGGRYA